MGESGKAETAGRIEAEIESGFEKTMRLLDEILARIEETNAMLRGERDGRP